MMSKKNIGFIYVSIIIICAVLLYNFTFKNQNKSTDNNKPILSVSAIQEDNFKSLMTWLNKHETLKSKTGLLFIFQEMHSAMKSNDYSTYIELKESLSDEISKLNAAEMESFRNFTMTLTKPEAFYQTAVLESGEGGNNCVANCALGTCWVVCLSGTHFMCECIDGLPKCYCYNIE